MIQCRLCGVLGHEAKGVVLQRVNETGVEGVWECRPVCGAQMKEDDCLVAAIEGIFDCQHPQVILGPPRRCANCGIPLSPCLHSKVVYEPHRQCAQCGISMPSPSEIAKAPSSPSYTLADLNAAAGEFVDANDASSDLNAPDAIKLRIFLGMFMQWLARKEKGTNDRH